MDIWKVIWGNANLKENCNLGGICLTSPMTLQQQTHSFCFETLQCFGKAHPHRHCPGLNPRGAVLYPIQQGMRPTNGNKIGAVDVGIWGCCGADPGQGAASLVVYLEWALCSISIERVSGNPGEHGWVLGFICGSRVQFSYFRLWNREQQTE